MKCYSAEPNRQLSIATQILSYLIFQGLLLQAAILARLSDYPAQAEKNMHHAAALVPLPLAAALQHDPQLVSVAVETFYYRDNEDAIAARLMRHFHPDQVAMPIK